LGQLRHAQGNIAEAEREFRRAIALRPTPTSWFALGDLLAQQGRHFEALECFRESALREPRPHEAWAAMGRSALAAQRPQEALDAANRALDANPYQGPAAVAGRGFTTRALVLRASAFQALGQPQPALESLDQAKKLGARGPTVDRLEKELGAARK